MIGGFERVYDENGRVRAGLGCPLGRESAGDGAQQFFTQGMMLYWDDTNRDARADYIFVFYGRERGPFDAFSNEEVQALGPEPTPGPDPNQPVRGFGTVYFNQPQVAEFVGTATGPEIELKGDQQGVIQYFEQGLMFWTPDYRPLGAPSIFVLYNDGTFERYDDPPAG
jgi:serine/threonine-protein kinase